MMLYDDFHCTEAMRMQLDQIISYCRLSELDYESAIEQMKTEGKLPAGSKKEGMLRIAELRQRLIR